MPPNSNQKGKRFERDVAKLCREVLLIPEARRSFGQARGGEGIPDVITHPEIHLECKNDKQITIWRAWDQANKDRRPGALPLVAMTKNNYPALMVMEFDRYWDLVEIFATHIVGGEE